MANLKISQLPNYTAGTNPDIWFVNNNSGETETSKIQLKEFNSLINGSGVDSIVSAPWLTSIPSTASTVDSISIGIGNNEGSDAGQNNILIGDSNLTSTNADRNILIGELNTSTESNNVLIGKEHDLVSSYAVVIGNGGCNFTNASFATYINSFNGVIDSTGERNTVIGSTDITINDPIQFAVVLGIDTLTPAYSNSTYVDGLHIRKNNSMDVGQASTSTFDTDMNSNSIWYWDVTDNVSGWTISNVRDGGHYRVIFKNTSGTSWNVDEPTSTGNTIWYNSGWAGQVNDAEAVIFTIDCVGTDLFIDVSGILT